MGITRDVSVRGLFVYTEMRPRLGAKIKLSYCVLGYVHSCCGRVVRHDERGVGVRILEIRGGALHALAHLVSKQAKRRRIRPSLGLDTDN